MSKVTKEKIKQTLPLEEQETTITWDRSNPTAEIYTHDPKLKRKYRECADEYPELFVITDDEEWGTLSGEFHSILVTISKPRKLSEKSKQRLKEQGKMLSKSKRLGEGI